jgi:hypothetical protein
MQGRTSYERIFSIMWILIGVAFYSFTIGNLQSILSRLDAGSSGLAEKLNTLSSFAVTAKLPENITNKLKKFLENNNAENNSVAQ